ncbi:MAG: hypothetical protein FWD89_00425 [Firmicutes bacterium]|nr:hypothetical protein [Bacillota bacterium]MCL2770764.1 hypothetical protein [Bacillota bacterium]
MKNSKTLLNTIAVGVAVLLSILIVVITFQLVRIATASKELSDKQDRNAYLNSVIYDAQNNLSTLAEQHARQQGWGKPGEIIVRPR